MDEQLRKALEDWDRKEERKLINRMYKESLWQKAIKKLRMMMYERGRSKTISKR